MSENTGGTPPSDDEPVPPDPQPPVPPAEPPVAPPPPPVAPPAPPAAPPVAPPAPPVAPPAPPVPPPAPPAPQYGQPGAYPPPPPPPPPEYGAPGAYPPPAPQYGQPAPGGYPPGAYPPPAGGYVAPPASPIGESYSYGWKQFTRHGGLFIGAGVVWLVILAVVFSILAAIFGGTGDIFRTTPGGRIAFSFGFVVLSLLGTLVSYLIQAIFIGASLDLTEGKRIGFGTFFRFVEPGLVVLTALLLTAITFVINLIPFFGWLINIGVTFLLLFTLWFVIGKRLSPVEAIKASYALVVANLSTVILFYLLVIATLIVGALVCGVGLVVAVPLVLLATAFMFKRLLGDPIAAIA